MVLKLKCTKLKNYRVDMGKNRSNYSIHAILIVFVAFCAFLTSAQTDELASGAIKVVCIDAGHGGKDPGCHGASNNEKDVCLSMALILGKKIKEQYPTIKVIYTRDKDVFVELDERAKIANRNSADLFICIHANAAGPTAYGAETYVLGLHRTDSQKQTAERENATIYLEEDKGEKYKDFDLSPDAIIARQLQLSVFLDQSISFASKVQKEFKALGRYDRGVKQAGFLVLYKTTMPSVLIETGFLTNPEEEKFLGSKESQEKMANAMFVAFNKYKNELEGNSMNDESPIIKKEDPKVIVKKETDKTELKVDPSKIIYRVQVKTSASKIETSSPEFKGMQVFEYQQEGLYKYAVGVFENNFSNANSYKNELRNSGFQHAFVIAFLGNERISLEKAVKLAEK